MKMSDYVERILLELFPKAKDEKQRNSIWAVIRDRRERETKYEGVPRIVTNKVWTRSRDLATGEVIETGIDSRGDYYSKSLSTGEGYVIEMNPKGAWTRSRDLVTGEVTETGIDSRGNYYRKNRSTGRGYVIETNPK